MEAVLEAAEYLNEYNQVALDAIRSTGGNNATRCVMVPGYDASIDGCMIDAFKLPDDTAKDRLIVSVHAYTPYYFALATDVFETEFDKSSKTDIDVLFSDLNDKFLSKGIPAVIGETDANNHGMPQERVKWADYYWEKASKYPNLACCL